MRDQSNLHYPQIFMETSMYPSGYEAFFHKYLCYSHSFDGGLRQRFECSIVDVEMDCRLRYRFNEVLPETGENSGLQTPRSVLFLRAQLEKSVSQSMVTQEPVALMFTQQESCCLPSIEMSTA